LADRETTPATGSATAGIRGRRVTAKGKSYDRGGRMRGIDQMQRSAKSRKRIDDICLHCADVNDLTQFRKFYFLMWRCLVDVRESFWRSALETVRFLTGDV